VSDFKEFISTITPDLVKKEHFKKIVKSPPIQAADPFTVTKGL
jgi:hypothetical protein